jgi:endo-1,4-beta-D-glucanase Y
VTAIRTAALALLALCGSCGTPGSRDGSSPLLETAWESYKQQYIRPSGNSVDPARDGETISEAQGYAMLRAAWMRDEATFDRVFRWTEQYLKRADGLYSWRWTSAGGGRILDSNTASDANQEIAFALIIGSQVFNDPKLLVRGRQLLAAIRTHERIDLREGWFPAAGDWAVSRRIANLSYFLPYAYPYFAQVDPSGRWEDAIHAGYDLLAKVLQPQNSRLVPDFLTVTAEGAPAARPEDSGLSADFTSDAMRIYWRVAVDCRWHKRVSACSDPLDASQVTSMLARDGALYTRYRVDGSVLERVESTSFYGSALPYLAAHAPAAAQALRASRLSAPAVRRLISSPNRYYDLNWVWFGIAATDGYIDTRMPPIDGF